MTARKRAYVFIDSSGSSLALLGAAVRLANEGRAASFEIVARSSADLFDQQRIAECVGRVAAADGLVMMPHGGTESIPDFDRFVSAAQGKLIHFQTTPLVPETFEVAREISADFGSPDFIRRNAYLSEGGVENLTNLLRFLVWDGVTAPEPPPPRRVACQGIHHPAWRGEDDAAEYLAWARRRLETDETAPVVGIWFYRSSWLTGDLEVVDALIAEIERRGAIPLPVFHLRFADSDLGNLPVPALIDRYFKDGERSRIDVLLSTMGGSLALVDWPAAAALATLDVPVLQAIVTYNPQRVWAESLQAVSPMDVSVNVAQPEFDGNLIGPVVGTREECGFDAATGAMLTGSRPIADRCRRVVDLAVNWARLRHTPPAERKVAILFHHYPPKNDRLGSAFGLDSFQSVKLLCDRLIAEGYRLEKSWPNGETLAFEMLDRLTNDRRYLPPRQLVERAVATIDRPTAEAWHAERADRIRREMDEKWGPPPGVTFAYDGKLLIGGLINGNVFIGIQPPRGRMEEEDGPEVLQDGTTIHDPLLPATHHYLAYYRWLRQHFGAQAVFHIGTHGTLEWLPGKSVGLSESCYPDAAIADLPNLYPYIVSNPGEGTQAKRRSYACLLDHMIPPQTNAGASEPIRAIEDQLDGIYLAKQQDPTKLPLLLDRLWESAEALHLDRDLGVTHDIVAADPDDLCRKLHGYLSEVEVSAINDGLHVFGCPPEGARFNETLLQLTRLPSAGAASLWDVVARAFGYDGADLRDNPGERVPSLGKTKGQILTGLLDEVKAAFAELDNLGWTEAAIAQVTAARFDGSSAVAAVLGFVAATVRPGLLGVTDELDFAGVGVAGRFVPPGASGAPTRGSVHVLPTGRNFYSVDPFKIPTPEAWSVGVGLGDALVERYRADTGRDPEQIGMVLWATSTMRTGGDDVAEILYLMGARPVWASNGRVEGVEAIPLSERKFARLDVTVRASGLLRDAFPNIMELIDGAVRMLAALDEPRDMNVLARNVAVDRDELILAGLGPEEASRRAAFRVFADKPGCYGAGVEDALDAGTWNAVEDLGDIYVHWGGYAYGQGTYGAALPQDFRKRLGKVDLTVQNADTREYDILSCDDYNAYHGGMNAAVKRAAGRSARSYTGDANDPRKPRIRATDEEGRFVFRTRVLNPKWIEGMKRHGYKGAGDISKLIDYCFQWDATSGILDDWQYAEMARTYAFDPAMRDFFKHHNPYALQNIVERLLEAIRRGLWRDPGADEDALEALFLEAEGDVEDALASPMRTSGRT